MLYNLNQIAGYEVSPSTFIESRWPYCNYIAIYDDTHKKVLNFKLGKDWHESECQVVYTTTTAKSTIGKITHHRTKILTDSKVFMKKQRIHIMIDFGIYIYVSSFLLDPHTLVSRKFLADIYCSYWCNESSELMFYSKISESG